MWHGVARSVTPLFGRRLEAAPPVDVARSESKPQRPARREPAVAAIAPQRSKSAPALAPMTRRERQKLARGTHEIDARLDLHGRTQAEARTALVRFLRRAQAEGLRFVLVVTGKGGRGEGEERGVLRRQVPLWLALPEFRPLVVGFELAAIGHGGEGALYVRVRRGER